MKRFVSILAILLIVASILVVRPSISDAAVKHPVAYEATHHHHRCKYVREGHNRRVVLCGFEKQYAFRILPKKFKGYRRAREYWCLNDVIMRESAWNKYADNPYSGAYGIPQALPGYKMATDNPVGSDWVDDSRVQLWWMVRMYIPDVYGTPCNAWGHEQQYGWYVITAS